MTAKDVAGNPTDGAFNEAIFQTSEWVLRRSLFTAKGPIVKPPLILQAGTGGAFTSPQTVSLPGAALTLADIGRTLRLRGSHNQNDGDFEILSVSGAMQAGVKARFALPDLFDGAVNWEVIDPRTGQIADDPSDVAVRRSGMPVTPTAVIGLRGQIVLPVEVTGPFEVDYSWFSNPRVEIRRLNSVEFRFNAWNRDPGGYTASNHNYRFNNVLITPGDYDPQDPSATREQPLRRDVKYRAYERAYTPILNDPTRLLLNTPMHRIAFPPAQRVLQEEVVLYEASTLPEAAPLPWVRNGDGSAVVGAGELTLVDSSTGTFPAGAPLFWTRKVDLTFDHVLSVAWRFSVNSVVATEGVWTGLTAGYSNDRVVYLLGYLLEGGVRKVGFLRRGASDGLADASAWTGGVDSEGAATGAAAPLDWGVLHSYRMFTDRNGVVKLYVDGAIVETLRISPDEAPFLDETNAPFDGIQGAFFGSLSRLATSTSTWDFYRYIVQPLNALQTVPSSIVTYEGDVFPEVDSSPWTPVGSHGTSVVNAGFLRLASTSATTPASNQAAGLVNGDFYGYVKLEPLLSASVQVAIDARLQGLTWTHGVDPDGLILAIDDGTRLLQLCFLAGASTPRLSYGGRSLPENFAPFAWTTVGTQPVEMRGRTLRITDDSATDYRAYLLRDEAPAASPARVLAATVDYAFEARFAVVSYQVADDGFVGAFVQAVDGTRAVGIQLIVESGQRHVAFHSDGAILPSGRFEFDWGSAAHTYRVRRCGDLVSLFVDGMLLGSCPYGDFEAVPNPGVEGILSFGSAANAAGATGRSVVDWSYCNAWRVEEAPLLYVGLWKGTDRGALTGYHLPLKAAGTAGVAGNVLRDTAADFEAAGVDVGDPIIVDDGPNKGVYLVASVSTTELTIPEADMWPAQPSTVSYRIARQTDWSVLHTYRVARDSTGTVSVIIDSVEAPAIQVDYDSVAVPKSSAGVLHILSGGLPAIAFGSFSAEHLEESQWDFVRYGITRNATGQNIVPPHHVLNQWNVMESPERLSAKTPLALTSFKSSSTGTTPQTAPDYLSRADVPAFTQLNQGTPPVPATQTSDRRGPFSVRVPSGTPYVYEPREFDDAQFNPGARGVTLEFPRDRPDRVMVRASVETLKTGKVLRVGANAKQLTITWGADGVLQGTIRSCEVVTESPEYLEIGLEGWTMDWAETFGTTPTVTLSVPEGFTNEDDHLTHVFAVPRDVLYTSLQLVETAEGALDLLTPFGDEPGPGYGGLDYTKEVCLDYSPNVGKPEESNAATPWLLTSDGTGEVVSEVLGGTLFFGTSSSPVRAAYINNTPLPDAPSLQTTATFRLRLAQDATLGLGDSRVRFGMSAPGMTVGLGFVTYPSGERFVEVYDLQSGEVKARATVDYLDGDYHEYEIVRDPSAGLVEVYIDHNAVSR